MKKDNTIAKGLIGGLALGLCFFILKRFGIDTSFVVPVGLGALVSILDFICFRPVVIDLRNKKLTERGVKTMAHIDEVKSSAVHPKHMVRDAMGKFVMPPDSDNVPTMYALTISYDANGRHIVKDVVVPEVTAMDILPFRIRDNEEIPIKYMESDPDTMLIDIPAVLASYNDSNEDFKHKGPFTAFVMTTIYVVYLITKVL